MKKILFFFAAALALCACNDKPKEYGVTFLMSVEITQVPDKGQPYSLEIYKAGDPKYNHKFGEQTEFPHTFAVEGGIQIKNTEHQVVALYDKNGEAVCRDTLPLAWELEKVYGKDRNLHFVNNGVYGIWHIVY